MQDRIPGPPKHRTAVICWGLALVAAGVGTYCWVKDPFFTSEGIGSGISFLAGCACIGFSVILVFVGLILARGLLLLFSLANLAIFVLAAIFATRSEYRVADNPIVNFFARTHWELVFAILACSILISAVVYYFLPPSIQSKGGLPPDPGAK